jgi:hypothetical protein
MLALKGEIDCRGEENGVEQQLISDRQREPGFFDGVEGQVRF